MKSMTCSNNPEPMLRCIDCGYTDDADEFDVGLHRIRVIVGDDEYHQWTDDPRCPKCGSDNVIEHYPDDEDSGND